MSTTSSGVNVISSSIDVGTIVDSLVYNASAPIRLMQSQTTQLQNRITALQGINSKLSTLLDKADNLLYSGETVPLLLPGSYQDRFSHSAFSQRTVTSSNASVITASAAKGTGGGSYAITVDRLAAAESLGSSNFNDTNTVTTGTGTLVIQVGAAGTNDPVTINIDSTNNTLTGVMQAINAKKAGFSASIINDGSSSPYRLLITSDKTGIANAVSVQDNLSGGQALTMTETVQAQDASFQVNGVPILKSSNEISDVIDGVTFTLHDKTTAAVNLTLAQDSDSIVSDLRELVSAYNDVNTAIGNQTAYNSTTKTAGVLSGDPTIRSIRDKIQQILTQSVNNDYTSYAVLSQVGLKFNNDGSITLDEGKLRDAISSNVTSVAALFLGDGAASDARVTVKGQTAATKAGTYDVWVNTLAQQASVTGAQPAETLQGPETLTVSINGADIPVNLSAGDDPAALVNRINAELTSQGVDAVASLDDTGRLQVKTNAYGSDQRISMFSSLAAGAGTSGVGNVLLSGNGVNIAGTINGDAAGGNGLTLTGLTGDETGLELEISQTTTGSYGSVRVSDGYTSTEGNSPLINLHSALDSITDPLTGPIQSSTNALNSNIRDLNDRISEYQDRISIQADLWTQQYSAADNALRMLTVSQSSLTAQTNSLSGI